MDNWSVDLQGHAIITNATAAFLLLLAPTKRERVSSLQASAECYCRGLGSCASHNPQCPFFTQTMKKHRMWEPLSTVAETKISHSWWKGQDINWVLKWNDTKADEIQTYGQKTIGKHRRLQFRKMTVLMERITYFLNSICKENPPSNLLHA